MIAPFKALAGFSPNCEAVLVQIEHCAAALSANRIIMMNKNAMINPHFFMSKTFGKVRVRKRAAEKICYSFTGINQYFAFFF